MKLSTIDDCQVIPLTRIYNTAGNITPITNGVDIPFSIQRVYYLYDVPGGEARGGHAHKGLQQLIISASGSFDVVLDDGRKKKTVTLNRPYNGLLIVPGIWRELENFSSGSICLVFASMLYSEDDYIRDYNDSKQIKLSV
jgi:hypothetical protein